MRTKQAMDATSITAMGQNQSVRSRISAFSLSHCVAKQSKLKKVDIIYFSCKIRQIKWQFSIFAARFFLGIWVNYEKK